MSEDDRQMWEGHAQALREELRTIPRHHFNVIKIRDREAELRRIEAKLGREAAQHSAYLTRRRRTGRPFFRVRPQWRAVT